MIYFFGVVFECKTVYARGHLKWCFQFSTAFNFCQQIAKPANDRTVPRVCAWQKRRHAIKWYIKSLWLFCNDVRQWILCKIHEISTNECAKIQIVQAYERFHKTKNNILKCFSFVRNSLLLHYRNELNTEHTTFTYEMKSEYGNTHWAMRMCKEQKGERRNAHV